MSKFIKSYFELPKQKKHMKFYSDISKHPWQFYPLPFVYIYFDMHHPNFHRRFWKNKTHGLYLSLNWLKYTYVIGFYKTLND